MPVNSYMMGGAALACVALLLAALPAQAQRQRAGRVLIEEAEQLSGEPTVRTTARLYNAFSGAYVLYDQCEREPVLNITPEKKAYVHSKFEDIARKYQISFIDAYYDYVGTPPKQSFVDNVAAHIAAQQQTVVNNMALTIRQSGCNSSQPKLLAEYVDEQQKADLAPPPEQKKYSPKVIYQKKSTRPTSH